MTKDRERTLLSRVARCRAAIITARLVLVAERREQFACFVIAGTPDTPAAYAQMGPGERAAIRRFDRAIKTADDALRWSKLRSPSSPRRRSRS